MLTLILLASLSTSTMHEQIERAVRTSVERPWSAPTMHAPAPGFSLSHRNLYVGILPLDWVSTEICCGTRNREVMRYRAPNGKLVTWINDQREENPLPLMGSSAGRAVTMSALAIGWTVLDRALEHERHHRVARVARWTLRHIVVVYAVSQINTNLGVTRHVGWEPPINPMTLLGGLRRK